MFYYKIIPLKKKLQPLTYFSTQELKRGDIVNIEIKNQKVNGAVLTNTDKPSYQCKEATYSNIFFSKQQVELAEFISSYYFSERSISYGLFTPFKNKKHSFESLSFNTKDLSNDQNKAFKFIQNKQSSLLFGDTGCGKTEIYIHLINETLKNKKNILFLMPEISLTPQMEGRLKEIFGDILAFWHSKVTKKKKADILKMIDNGKIRILAGARSALFLPMPSLGLIIVDEEHDDAYKSNSKPNYNARDIALYFAHKNNIKIVLGSATPSITTYYKAIQNDSIIRLKGTYHNTKKEYLFCSNDTDKKIIDTLKNTLKTDNQAIVFLPTRANFKYLICNSCQQNIQCPNCSVGMSLHLKEKLLKCHYCQYKQDIPTKCQCGGELSSNRIGTQEYAKLLKEYINTCNIECFDRDAITTQKKLADTLSRFNNQDIDILVGTQMLSKGHDYHNVQTSIILGIDYIANGCDYRAKEKAISLMVQISGRSGRKNNGTVLIQTSNDDYYKKYINDYEVFIKEELEIRKDLYPPFAKLAIIKISHSNKDKANKKTKLLAEFLNSNLNDKTEIIGFGESLIEKIANKWRYSILIRSKDIKSLHKTLMPLRNTDYTIDIDPIDFT